MGLSVQRYERTGEVISISETREKFRENFRGPSALQDELCILITPTFQMSYWPVPQTARLSLSPPAYELSRLLPTSGQAEVGRIGIKKLKNTIQGAIKKQNNNVLAC